MRTKFGKFPKDEEISDSAFRDCIESSETERITDGRESEKDGEEI